MPDKDPIEAVPKATIGERADPTTALIAEVADNVVERAEQVATSVTRGADEVAGSIDDTGEIIDRPVRALGVAMAIGFFVGVMAAR